MLDATSHSFAELRSSIECALQDLLRAGHVSPAARYAMFSGGKRIRPMLTLLAAQAAGGDVRSAIPVACAIECLHTASLIWDDMPCMDNACERRGASPVHVAFSEGAATLAALSLLNQAYAIFGRSRGLVAEAALCVAGMIEGQAADLQGGPQRDHRKTAGLMRLTFTAGAIACDAPQADVRVLARCGTYVGEAYQILDDFEDGDAGSRAGAEERLAGSKSVLQRRFGARALPLLAAIDQIADHFVKRKPVAA